MILSQGFHQYKIIQIDILPKIDEGHFYICLHIINLIKYGFKILSTSSAASTRLKLTVYRISAQLARHVIYIYQSLNYNKTLRNASHMSFHRGKAVGVPIIHNAAKIRINCRKIKNIRKFSRKKDLKHTFDIIYN